MFWWVEFENGIACGETIWLCTDDWSVASPSKLKGTGLTSFMLSSIASDDFDKTPAICSDSDWWVVAWSLDYNFKRLMLIIVLFALEW